MWRKKQSDCGKSKRRHRAPFHTPRRIGSHSTEHRLTLHGASGYTPRSIGLHSTERKTTPCREVFQPPFSSPSRNGFHSIGVHGKSRAPLLMRLLFGFPNEKQLMGAYLKSRRDERPQTGVFFRTFGAFSRTLIVSQELSASFCRKPQPQGRGHSRFRKVRKNTPPPAARCSRGRTLTEEAVLIA